MGVLVGLQSLSQIDAGLRWYDFFGNRPWIVRMTAPDVFVPAHVGVPLPPSPLPPSPSPLPAYAGIFQSLPGSRPKAAHPVTWQAVATSSLAPALRTLHPIPGQANTLKKVEEFFKKYPWISVVNTQWNKEDLRQYASIQNRTAEVQLRLWLLSIQINDRVIFDAAVKNSFAHIIPSMNTVGNLVNDILRGGNLNDLRYILRALEEFYFGDTTIWSSFIPPQQRLELHESIGVIKMLRSFNVSFDYAYYSQQRWFFYVARVMFPATYGYSPPEIAAASARARASSISFSPSIFTLVTRLKELPEKMRDYSRCLGESNVWCKLERELDAFVLKDPEIIQGIFKQKETSSKPIEITLLDPSEDQKALVLRTLLDCTVYDSSTKSDVPTYRGLVIRLIVKRSTSLGHFRLASLEDYDILEPKDGHRREFRQSRCVEQW